MQCSKHPEHEAEGMCAYSGKPFCGAELVEVDGRNYAKENVARVIAEAKHGAAMVAKAEAPQRPMVFMNSSSASAVAVRRPKPTSHGFHLVMTILTCGLWIPIWILAARSK